MSTDQDRDPLYADSKPGDLGDEIIEVGIERRSNRAMGGFDAIGRAAEALDKLGLTDQMTATQVLELQYEHRRLLAWAMGPDVRGATLQQLRAMKLAFDVTGKGGHMSKPAVRYSWIERWMRRKEHFTGLVDTVNVLDAQFVWAYIEAFEPRAAVHFYGAPTCPQLSRDLSAMFKAGRLTRSIIGIEGMSGMGFPRWTYVYKIPGTKQC